MRNKSFKSYFSWFWPELIWRRHEGWKWTGWRRVWRPCLFWRSAQRDCFQARKNQTIGGFWKKGQNTNRWKSCLTIFVLNITEKQSKDALVILLISNLDKYQILLLETLCSFIGHVFPPSNANDANAHTWACALDFGSHGLSAKCKLVTFLAALAALYLPHSFIDSFIHSLCWILT